MKTLKTAFLFLGFFTAVTLPSISGAQEFQASEIEITDEVSALALHHFPPRPVHPAKWHPYLTNAGWYGGYYHYYGPYGWYVNYSPYGTNYPLYYYAASTQAPCYGYALQTPTPYGYYYYGVWYPYRNVPYYNFVGGYCYYYYF